MAASELSGQLAVITGATSGIGLAAARELHAQGMRLVLSGRCASRLAPVGNELDSPAIAGDVTDPATPSRLLDAALSEHGRCDAVLNGAGTIEVDEIGSVDIDRVCAMARVNVEASYRNAYAFMQHFVRCDAGRRHAAAGQLHRARPGRHAAPSGLARASVGGHGDIRAVATGGRGALRDVHADATGARADLADDGAAR